jgi:hypothetical protein
MSGNQFDLTTHFNLIKPRPTMDGDAWGGHLNSNMDLIDSLLNSLGTNKDLIIQNLGTVTAPTLTIDFTVQRAASLTLAANLALTVKTTTGNSVFVTGMMVITQDGVGSRDITWPGNFRWQGGYSPALSTVPGSTDILQVSTFDGGASWFAAIALQAPP